jgi:hypothetical protein
MLAEYGVFGKVTPLRIPADTPIYRVKQGEDYEAVLRRPKLSASADAVEMVVDIYELDASR